MKLSRRHLLKGLTASAAAHSFGVLPAFSASNPSLAHEFVVFQFGHSQDEPFHRGVQLAAGPAANLTTVNVHGDLLANLRPLRDQLARHQGKRAVAFLDHAQHAVFQELIREARVKLLQVGNHSWSMNPVQHSTHRVMAAQDTRYAESLANLMSLTGWNYRLEVAALIKAFSTSHPQIWESDYPNSTELGLVSSPPTAWPTCHLGSLLGYALVQHETPAIVSSAAPVDALRSLTPTAASPTDSAVTLLLEL